MKWDLKPYLDEARNTPWQTGWKASVGGEESWAVNTNQKKPLYVLSFSLQKLILSGVGRGGESVCYLVGKDQSNFHKDSATCRKQLTTPKGPGK